MLRTIHLHGTLADRFGSEPLRLDVDNLRDLIFGLDCVKPGFRAALGETPYLAIVKRTPTGFEAITPESFAFNFGQAEDLHIAGAVVGAGVDVAAITFLGFTGWAAVGAYFTTMILVSFVVGSVVQSLVKVPGAEGSERPDQRPSHLFNGPVNVNEQGYPVPLVYGEFRVGSVTISTGVTIEELISTTPDNPDAGSGTGGQDGQGPGDHGAWWGEGN